MQRVGLSLNPEQYQKLIRLINQNALEQNALEITEVKENPDNLDDDQAVVALAELLKKTFHETQNILNKL